VAFLGGCVRVETRTSNSPLHDSSRCINPSGRVKQLKGLRPGFATVVYRCRPAAARALREREVSAAPADVEGKVQR